jgi:acyl carrier protein
MTKERLQLIEIIETIVKNAIDTNSEDYEKYALQIILSNSVQAATFVSIIEEEFEVEFDDDDINLEFFSSLDIILDFIKLRRQV